MADPNNKNGAQYVVANALFTCQYGVTPAQLQVTQNQKLLAQNKLVATDKEVQFNPPAQTFGVCSMNPNKQAGQPCLYAQGKWNPTTLYQSNNTNIVTEDSEMLCAMFAGKIKTIFPGQVASVSAPQLKKMEMEFAPFLIWEVNSEQNAKDAKKKMSSFKVSKIKMGNFLSGNGTEIKCRKGEKYRFEVTDKLDKKQAKYVSWIVGRKTDRMQTVEVEKKVNGKTEKTQQDLPVYEWVPYELIGTQFQIAFHHLDDYFVGAVGYGTDFYNRQVKDRKDIYEQVEPSSWNAMFFVHVQDNRIESVSVKECTRVVGDTYYVKKSKSAITVTAKTELPYDTNFEMVGCLALQKDYGKMPEGMCHYKDGELEMKMEPGNVGQEYLVHFIMTKKAIPVGFPSVWSSKDIVICFYDIATIKCTSKEWFKKDCSGKFPKARPGNDFVFEVVKSDGTSGEKFDLIDWKILFNGKEIKEIKDQKSIAYNLYEIGKYEIKAFLNDTAYYSDAFQQKKQPHDSSLVKEISHTIEVKNNTVESVSLLPNYGVKYVGVEYPIEIMYDYGANTTPEEIAAVTLNAPGAIVDKKRLVFKANKPSNGYVINATLNGETTSSSKISIVECEYSIWTFCDTNGNHIDKIGWIRNDGKEYEFGIIGCVPSWCYVNGTPKDNRKITVVLKETTTKQVVGTFPNIELSDEGEFRVNNIKSGEIVKFLLEKCGFAKGKDIRLMFCVYNAPSSIVKNLSQSLDYGLFAQSNTLTITNGFFVEESSFIDPDNGKKLIAIKKYGDKVKIRMQIINPGKKKLCLRIYENCDMTDPVRKEYDESDLKMDENGVVELDVPTDESGHISHEGHSKLLFASRPRLFYYVLLDKNDYVVKDYFKQVWGGNNAFTIYKILHSYPTSPGDAHWYNYHLDEKTPMNYYEQLKLVKEKEENKFCETYATLAPVVIGDEEEKEESHISGKCFCHRDFSENEMVSILKALKGEKWDGKSLWEESEMDRKSVSDFTHEINVGFRKFGIGKCIQKIIFLAIAAAETGNFRCSEEKKSDKKSSQSTYKGRGLLQLTGSQKEGQDYYEDPGVYERYNLRIHNEHDDFVKNPSLLAKNLHYAVDSSCYYFARFKTIPEFSDAAVVAKENREGLQKKQKIWEKAIKKTLSETAILVETDDDGEKKDIEKGYYFLINKVLNGYLPKDVFDVKPNSWNDRKKCFEKIKNAFKYDPKVCKESEQQIFPGEWHDPVDKMMCCYFSQHGHKKPYNGIFCTRETFIKDSTTIHCKHPGVDLFAPLKSNVYACLSGEIKELSTTSATGGIVVYLKVDYSRQISFFEQRKRNYKLLHFTSGGDNVPGEKDNDGNFSTKNGFILTYMHLSEVFVKKGDYVTAGDLIGKSGRTGNAPNSQGPHVHFEIRSDDQTFAVGFNSHANPAYYLYFKQYKREVVEEKEVKDGKENIVKKSKIRIFNCHTCQNRTLCSECEGVLIDNPETSASYQDYDKITYADEDLNLQKDTVMEMRAENSRLNLKN